MRWTKPAGQWASERSEDDNPVAVAANLLALLGVPFAPKRLRERIRTHPKFPNLPALIDSLGEAGVSAQAVSGEVDELFDVGLPAIAHFKQANGAGRFVVLTEASRDRLRYLDPREGSVDCSPAEFARLWSGVLLLTSVLPDAGQGAARAARRAEQLESLRVPLLLGIGVLVLAGLALFGLPAVPAEFRSLWPWLAAVKTAGLAASGVLVALDPRHGGQMVRRLCPAGRVVDCASVLGSPAAKLGGWIPMADLGVLYFVGGLLLLAAAPLTGDYSTPLGLLTVSTLFALAYSVFSVAYQAFVLRKWCWLCVVVTALFWVEALLISVASPLGLQSWFAEPPWAGWTFIAAAFVLPGVAWGLVKPPLMRGAQAEQLLEELMRHRRNPVLLQHALDQQPPADIGRIEPEIEFGAAMAPSQLTLVVHPLCSACQEVHHQVERLVAESAGQLRCTVRLGYRATDPGREIGRRLIAIAVSEGGQAAAQALHAWYADPAQGEALWLDRWPAADPPAPQQIDEIFDAHSRWVVAARLDGVPAIFLDGQALPREFSVGDLKILLRDWQSAGRAAA